MSILDSNMTAGTERFMTIGRNPALNNQGEISFKYNGNANGSNALRLGINGNPSIINILGRDNGCVGINNDDPYATLDVKGDAIIANVYTSNLYTAESIQCIGGLTVSGNVQFSNDLNVSSNVEITNDLYVDGNVWLKGGVNNGGGNTHFPFSGDNRNYIRGTTIICDSTGANVGIGTSSPSYKLDCAGTGNFSKLRLNSTTLNHVQVYTVSIGSSSNRKSQFTIFGTFPTTGYHVSITPIAQNSSTDDNFAFVIQDRTSTSIQASCCRVDSSGGWSQNLSISVLIVGYD
jgi:hypothetical protein